MEQCAISKPDANTADDADRRILRIKRCDVWKGITGDEPIKEYVRRHSFRTAVLPRNIPCNKHIAAFFKPFPARR